MTDNFKKKTPNKSYRLLCLLTLLVCACTDVPEFCSDHNPLDPLTQFCHEGKAVVKCGGKEYNPYAQFCYQSRTLVNKCGGTEEYNPSTQGCYGGVVRSDANVLTVNITPADGGSVSRNPNQTTYKWGTSVTVTATPKNGYTFTGWSGASTSTTSSVTITMDGNKTLSAGFGAPNAKRFTVSFDGNGAAAGAPQSVNADSGTVITLPDQGTMTRTGYYFAGWNTNSGGAGTYYGANSSYTVTGDATLFAEWTGNTHTLTTSASPSNGGSVSRSPNKNTYAYGEQVTVTATPASGYTFTGWSGASWSTNSTITVTMDGDKALTAGFGAPNAKRFTVYFNGNGATSGSAPAAISADSGSTITLPDQQTMEKSGGYRFDRWNTNSGGTGTYYPANSSYRVTGNVTLYARWIRLYTVTYDGNGATVGVPDAVNNVDSGSVITLSGQGTMTRSGYSFGGWNTNGSGTGTDYATNSYYTVTGNITLYAKWTGNTHTLTINMSPTNGGTVSRSPNKDTYTYGEQVTVTATPASGYTFTGWAGASTSTSASVTITMDGNKTLTAGFQQQAATYTLTTNVSPTGGGSVSRSPNQTSYTSGTSVTVTATAASGYTFTGWAGASTSTSSSVTITMNGDKTLTANFQQQPVTYTLTTNVSPTGGGTVSRSPNQTSYTSGTSVTVTATAASGYTFTGWSGASTSTSASVTITMDGNKTLTANFQQQPVTYSLTTNVSPTGGGTVSRSPNQTSYTSGTSVTVTATAASGYTFTGWSGASTSTSSSVTITMNGDKTLTANFQQQPVTYTLTTNVSPTGGGTVSRSPNQTSYTSGASVTVTATAASGYTFTGWSGASTSTSSSVAITMNGDKSLTAFFKQTGKISGAPLTYQGQTYQTVMIGGKRWMAENLNYETADSWCYENDPANCDKYGRLYTWASAKTACPSGWHLPTRQEWGDLAIAAGGTGDYGTGGTAGKVLKATSGWYNSGNGTDAYGFSALPGGYRSSYGSFYNAGYYGYWWTATEYSSGYAYNRYMGYDIDNVGEFNGPKEYGNSVRCVED